MRYTKSRPRPEKELQATPEKTARARELRCEMTPAERKLWAFLRDNRLAGLHFRRQQPRLGFIMDFYCHAARLCIEVDGPIHLYQGAYDAERDIVLLASGVRIMRVTNDAVLFHLPQTLAHIRATCEEPLPQPTDEQR